MSGKKRAAGDEEAKPLATEVDLTDEQVQVLEGVEKMLNKAQTVLALRAYKFMVPKFAQRREALKKIPGFWSRALLRHGLVALHTQHTADQDALSYLEDIWVERDQTELRAFKIEFHFKENPYFEEKVLVKEFKYVAPPSTSTATDEDGLTEAQVDFNEERDLAPQTITITWKTDSKNLTKLHPRVADDEDDMPAEPGSFFNFFTVAEDPFELGPTIVEEVFPDAIDLFLGRNDEELEDMTDSDEEQEDDAEEEIDLEKPKKKVKLSRS